ncbi:MAG: SGNH/GDSL hydrolase family protein [Clostridia bacterium]|nr:SGNH/GDSL hydrolase family protein [Clostridia bacterium]
MNITKLIKQCQDDYMNTKKPTIAFLGDSVTQGCFEIFKPTVGNVETIYDPEYAYHRYVAKIFGILYPKVPINIINAGLSGDNVVHGLERLERDVLCHKPDLTVVCFGLNDCTRGDDGLQLFYESLSSIFKKLQEIGSEVIFMTPNMLNTKVSPHTNPDYISSAAMSADRHKAGLLDRHVEWGIKAAKDCGVRVCDVYAKWKCMEANGVDTTELLSNHINHPIREMNWLFAYSLVEEMMK